MKAKYDGLGQMLPYGELIRGFANQGNIAAGELKKVLRSRGIFFADSEKEVMVPAITTLLLSPREFQVLRDCQNTREDNLKKSSSRIQMSGDVNLIDIMPDAQSLYELISQEHVNYKLTGQPTVVALEKNLNKVLISYELERYDLNKSWYEAKNIFTGSLTIERAAGAEALIIKSYTSAESEEVGSKFQNAIVSHIKSTGYIHKDSELQKILFSDFTNEERISFFWQLTSKMDSVYVKFRDIEDVQFRPDEGEDLPDNIGWMLKKRQLVFKGSDIHNTSFIKDREYHKYLQFWSLEAKFEYVIDGNLGTCSVEFSFRDFLQKEDKAEFEVNIASLTPKKGQLIKKEKNGLKKDLLDKLEDRKNQLYKKFFEQKGSANASVTEVEESESSQDS